MYANRNEGEGAGMALVAAAGIGLALAVSWPAHEGPSHAVLPLGGAALLVMLLAARQAPATGGLIAFAGLGIGLAAPAK